MPVSLLVILCSRRSPSERLRRVILIAVSIKHGLRTTDYGLGIKHGLGYKTRTKHYGLGIKYGLGYEQAQTGWCKLHLLSVLRAKATSSTCYVTWPMGKMRADQLH